MVLGFIRVQDPGSGMSFSAFLGLRFGMLELRSEGGARACCSLLLSQPDSIQIHVAGCGEGRRDRSRDVNGTFLMSGTQGKP